MNVSNWNNAMVLYAELGPEFNKVEDFPEGCIGFVYLIKNRTTGLDYIGKKSLYSTITKRKTKKEIALENDKRRSLKKRTTKQSDWISYVGSAFTFDENKVKHYTLKEQALRGDVIDRYIIRLAFSKQALTLAEMEEQVSYDMLRDEKSLNANILGKFFRKTAIDCPKTSKIL